MKDTPQCPVCNSDNFKYIKEIEKSKIIQCKECTLTYTYPEIKGKNSDVGKENSSITSKEYYDGVMSNFDAQSNLAIEKAPKILKKWSKLSGKETSSILEVGCGTGQYYSAFK